MKNKKNRDPLDRYYTPKIIAKQGIDLVLPHLVGNKQVKSILEPSAGRGVFLPLLRKSYKKATITALDLDPERGPWRNADISIRATNFLTWKAPKTKYDLIIGNPPFKPAEDFVIKCKEIAKYTLFILRSGFLNSKRRWHSIYRKYPPSVIAFLPSRPSFTRDGNVDRYDYCWVGWNTRGFKETARAIWLPPFKE